MATRAFNALKEVSSALQDPAPQIPGISRNEPQPAEPLVPRWEPEVGLWELGWGDHR